VLALHWRNAGAAQPRNSFNKDDICVWPVGTHTA